MYAYKELKKQLEGIDEWRISEMIFFDDVYKLLEDARKNVKKAVNLAMVYSYFEVGWKIVEEEQNGEDRAQYGQYIVKELSEYLTQSFGKGFSVTNLKQMRQFYCVYSQDQIGQTLSDQFRNLPTASTGRKFFLVEFLGLEEKSGYSENDLDLSSLLMSLSQSKVSRQKKT